MKPVRAVVMPARTDDASGEGFRRALDGLRQNRRRPTQLIPGEVSVEWELEVMPWACPAIREATASVDDYLLYVVEMREGFLVGENAHMPKISWALLDSEDDFEPLTGSAAPTFEEAMLRAEMAVRVQLGVALDG